MSCITVTYGERVENHAKMQLIGTLADKGLNLNNLQQAKQLFEEQGNLCEIVNLNQYLPNDVECKQNAYVFIVRNGVSTILNPINKSVDDLFNEQNDLDVDTKAFMYGRVVNKHARYNLCFDDSSQEPNYEDKKGRIIAFNNVPLTMKIRDELPNYFGDSANQLKAEGNYYYDIKKCGIGYHGDAERKIVIALRLGKIIPLHFHWFMKNKPVGDLCALELNDGDMYAMSEKATGFDWKKSSKLTLRHAAGSNKFLKLSK